MEATCSYLVPRFASRTVTNLKASMPGIESTDLVRTPGLMALLRRASHLTAVTLVHSRLVSTDGSDDR